MEARPPQHSLPPMGCSRSMASRPATTSSTRGQAPRVHLPAQAVSVLRFGFGGLPRDVGSNSPRTGVSTAGGSGAAWGQQRVSFAGQDVAGVVVTVHPAASITGRILFDGATKPSQRPTIDVDAADGAPSRGRRSMNWVDHTFVIGDLAPGQYSIRIRGLGDSWAIQTISAGGRDYTRVPIDLNDGRRLDGVVVTMTDRAATLVGAVRDAQGRPLTNAAVLLFPAERDAWQNFGIAPDRIRSSRPVRTGKYRMAALVAGDYQVVAVDEHCRTRGTIRRFSRQSSAWLPRHVVVGAAPHR